MARHSSYTFELAKEICEVISCTSKGIKKLCKEHEHWPSHDTIYKWLNKYPEFSDLYTKAKRQQIEVIVDEVLEIADDSGFDAYVNDEGNVVCDNEAINRARLRVDTRKWLAGKLCPRLYGEKDEHVNVKFPNDLTNSGALIEMSAEVFKGLATKELTPKQTKTLLSALKDHATAIVVNDFEKRLNKLENNNAQ